MTYKPNYDEAGKIDFCERIAARFSTGVVTNPQIREFIKENNLPFPHFLINDKSRDAGWGKYRVSAGPVNVPVPIKSTAVPAFAALQLPDVPTNENQARAGMATVQADYFVPAPDPTYVAFGFHDDLEMIISSKLFYTIYITGQSGNGKTLMPMQICSKLKREIIRVNITKDTDDLVLFGSYELLNGSTIYREGPVITAMRRGAILLLDEVDYGSERLLCLQAVLEGKPILDKMTNTMVYPAPGFNIIATANTKGKGSSDGRFIGANVMNEAFLERFAITVEQGFPVAKIEAMILERNLKELGIDQQHNLTFVSALTKWADQVRRSFDDGVVDELISTRRLVHIIKAFSVFKDRKKATTLCLNRFDTDTRTKLYDFYSKIDADIDVRADWVAPPPKAPAPAPAPAGTWIPPLPVTAQTDIEYMPIAASMSRTYKTTVSIRNEGGHVAVYSNGKRTARAAKDIPSVTNVRDFENAIKKMVEINAI